MTNEEAIIELEWIKRYGFKINRNILGTERMLEALDMAIKLLSTNSEVNIDDNN